MRILIVDDQEDVRLLLSFILKGAGHDVVEARDGRSALLALERDPAIDVAVLDVQMPDMTGWEVLRAIRFDQSLHRLAVVMCTVKSGLPDLDAAWRLEADGYVTKPFEPVQLLSAVREAALRRGDHNGGARAG